MCGLGISAEIRGEVAKLGGSVVAALVCGCGLRRFSLELPLPLPVFSTNVLETKKERPERENNWGLVCCVLAAGTATKPLLCSKVSASVRREGSRRPGHRGLSFACGSTDETRFSHWAGRASSVIDRS